MHFLKQITDMRNTRVNKYVAETFDRSGLQMEEMIK